MMLVVGRRFLRSSGTLLGGWLLSLATVGCADVPIAGSSDSEPTIQRPICATGEALGETTVSYAEDLVPILTRVGCLASSCHGGSNPSVGFALSTWEASFEPGSGATLVGACPIVPGDPDASYLIEKLSSNPRTGRQMPDRRPPLNDEEVQLFVTWIQEGAPNN
jgi:hypothetical protein